ncbi:hypothetical protein [Ramlibacter tataouinensis]|uniref:Uncharacterized protein n=1 Tax=Ramlibacter tataouinensis (strain ATCC BAA-407 / DSM 14655 / LMG 21543 / TTB310) TaxID=365046 RepID=F5Y0H1_RAMTT|nr:hypothetical protein [Ramlibacter tataouinensis]AEG93377.1 Hypothetical protein Rta_22790 [Ramlibacter tataouinensis TTB310]
MFGMGGRAKPPAPAPAKKPKAARKPALVPVTVKLEPAQHAKFQLLGGEAWLRGQLDAAAVEVVFKA